jgi:hypothetical protein
MSNRSIPLIVTAATIALMFGWVQVLNFAFPYWHRALKRCRSKRVNVKRAETDLPVSDTSDQTIPAQAAPRLIRSSPRLAAQSRVLLEAISARREGDSRSRVPLARE